MRKSISFKLIGGDPITGVGGQLILSEDVLMYTAFRELYEADQTSDKRESFMDLKYVKFVGEEEGAFSHLDGHERNMAATMESYGIPNPKLSKERRELRDAALRAFKSYEETEEGLTLDMLKSRVHVIRKVIKATEKNPADIKTDKDLMAYMESSEGQTTALLKLTTATTKVYEQIQKQGGRKKTKNIGDAVTSPNERGDFSVENIERRLRQRNQLPETTPA